MSRYTVPHIRLGTTSFLVQEDFVPGFRFAAERCEDVSLLLLSIGKDEEFLIRRDDVLEIANIIAAEGVTLNIHMPCDHSFDTAEGARLAVEDTERVLDRITPLSPHSYVQHVAFHSLENILLTTEPGVPGVTDEQARWTAEALRDMAKLLPSPEQLCIENLEAFPPDLWDRWLDGSLFSRCVDLGHLWKDGFDASEWLARWLPRTRMLHLHGLFPRHGQPVPPGVAARSLPMTPMRSRITELFSILPKDHKSLALMPDDMVDSVTHLLWRSGWEGVVNLEMFNLDDFLTSRDVLLRSRERYERGESADA